MTLVGDFIHDGHHITVVMRRGDYPRVLIVCPGLDCQAHSPCGECEGWGVGYGPGEYVCPECEGSGREPRSDPRLAEDCPLIAEGFDGFLHDDIDLSGYLLPARIAWLWEYGTPPIFKLARKGKR